MTDDAKFLMMLCHLSGAPVAPLQPVMPGPATVYRMPEIDAQYVERLPGTDRRAWQYDKETRDG